MINNKMIKSVILRKNCVEIAGVLAEVKKNREINILFSVLIELCDEKIDFDFTVDVQNILREYCITLNALSSFEYASKLGAFIREGKSISCSAVILQLLVESTLLMSATKLRNWIKTELVEIFDSVYEIGNLHAAAILATCLYYTLVIELNYSPKVDQNLVYNLIEIWKKLLNSRNFEEFIILQICSFLFYLSVGNIEKANQIAEKITKQNLLDTQVLDCANNLQFSYTCVLTNFVLSNLSPLCLAFPSTKGLRPLIKLLVVNCKQMNIFDDFLTQFSKLANLRYSARATKIKKILYGILSSSIDFFHLIDAGSEFNGNELTNGATFMGNSVAKSRKRKLNDFFVNGSHSNALSESMVDKTFCLRLFDGDSIEVKKHFKSNDTILKYYKASSSEKELTVKRIKQLRKCCSKVRKYFCASFNNQNLPLNGQCNVDNEEQEKNKRKQIADDENELGINLVECLNGVNVLLQLIAKIDFFNLPLNIVSLILESVKLSNLNRIKTTIFLPQVFEAIKDSNAAGDLMKVLRMFVVIRGDFKINVDSKLIDLFMAEDNACTKKNFKINALQLVAVLLRKERCELSSREIALLISMCLSFCQPVAYRYSGANSNVSVDDKEEIEKAVEIECEKDKFAKYEKAADEAQEAAHQFVLAELAFLNAALNKYPHLMAAQSGVLMGLLPDFFQQLALYRENSWQLKIDSLEHALTTFCSLIKRERNRFHKAIPFAMSNWLALETRVLIYPTFLLLSSCDNFDLALLSTNLLPREKRKFAVLQTQFYNLNKIIG